MKMQLKDVLKALRTKDGLKQSDVAEKLGLKVNTYQSYERGQSEPSCATLNKLADFYGVTTDYLLGREPLPNPFADLNLCDEDEAAVIEKFMSLPDSFRACALELLKELGGAVKEREDSGG